MLPFPRYAARFARIRNVRAPQPKHSKNPPTAGIWNGQGGGVRTHDLKTPSLARYQLRHALTKRIVVLLRVQQLPAGLRAPGVVHPEGVEPPTAWFEAKCSIH